jgi:S1-C subfamily serine protease
MRARRILLAFFAASVLCGAAKAGEPQRGMLGAELTESPSIPAAVVVRVLPDSAASRAGLEAGDLITAANGQRMQDSNALRDYVATLHAGDRLVLDVSRHTPPVQLHLTAVLTALPEQPQSTASPTEPPGK